jgi:hypothetical protein
MESTKKSLTQKRRGKRRKTAMQKPLLNPSINGEPEPLLSCPPPRPHGRVRYLVTALAGLGISCAYIMRVNLSVAVMPIADRLWEGGATEQR